ncbi:AAA domain-containing protein [Halovenus halobia]|uniref:AAA domain-containing protein n=1 Tax=Halovenus halobia TaxID=3396622 RepID=UPI003F5553FF
MTGDASGEPAHPADQLRIEQLTESHRFDEELAQLLTQFQYREDGVTLTAAEARPLPTRCVDPATGGQETMFESDSSLVFVCYDDREHTMVNPIETRLIDALASSVHHESTARPDGGASGTLGEGPGPEQDTSHTRDDTSAIDGPPSVGVVTPHNAQRGALGAVLPESVTANTVEKYQGGERDIIAVSATVSDPQFARNEERFILNPRRLLVAISRSKLLTIVVCSTALFEVAPEDSERLDDGPVWARLFTQAVGRDAQPAWAGLLGEFVGDDAADHADVPVQVYPSDIDTDRGDQ